MTDCSCPVEFAGSRYLLPQEGRAGTKSVNLSAKSHICPEKLSHIELRLTRLARHPYLAGERPDIQHMLARGLKAEQGAVLLATRP